jgi:NitT/TauT family transport system permease protein
MFDDLKARSMAATQSETILRVLLPGSLAHILTGVRLAIGIIWIVLVPVVMLGVSTGMGKIKAITGMKRRAPA